MSKASRLAPRGGGERPWLYALAVTVGALVAVVLPTAARLRRSARNLERIRKTYALRLSWVGQKDVLERRVQEQEEGVARLEAKLLTGAAVARFTQEANAAARAAGCSVLSTRPAPPRVLARPEPKGADAAAKKKQNEQRPEFVERPVRLALQGEYAHLSALLLRLCAGDRHVRITRLALQPSGDDREQLGCDIELAGYGLTPRAEGG